jgi:hypothetical protein
MKLPFVEQLKLAGLPAPEPEHQFALPRRRWAFDWAWPAFRVSAEREGGTWAEGEEAGRHSRGKGYRDDCVKYSNAAILGWCVVRFTSDMEASGEALALIERALLARGWRRGGAAT